MGGVLATLGGVCKALSCRDCARYVCNSMDIQSQCCHHLCDLEVKTDLVEVAESDSEYEIDVTNCCHLKKT